MKVFIPMSEELMEQLGLSMDDLVPFDLAYEVFRPGAPFPVGEPEADTVEPV
ncbi:MAG: hypothetical protein PVH91_16450 [Pseudomonadales bacterium]|jgi:hypothetical protein